ncbi:hypothetical protein [Virgibacillus ihumii]|uniref:hypothetical protein n=1 Tax=Virgibacillus ihumii TaxID=2686091 RepID=UPI0031B621ED
MMKKAVLIVVIVGMLGWAVYDFVSSSNDKTVMESDKGFTSETETASQGSSQDQETEEVTKTGVVGLDVGDITRFSTGNVGRRKGKIVGLQG